LCRLERVVNTKQAPKTSCSSRPSLIQGKTAGSGAASILSQSCCRGIGAGMYKILKVEQGKPE